MTGLIVLLLLPVFASTYFSVLQKGTADAQRPTTATVATSAGNDSTLLETGKGEKLREATKVPTEIKVVSYNIRWRSGDDLKKLIKWFREDPEIGSPTIAALQEVDRQKKRSGKTNTVKLLADELGLHYAWAAPPTAKPGDEEETGVALLSVYPLSDVQRIVLPHEGPNRRRRVALGATVHIDGQQYRVYSVHSETRLSMGKKLQQMNAVLLDLAKYPKETPAIIMGDLNTWESNADRKTIKLFSDAGMTTPFVSQSTFSRRILFVPIQFRLDWVWLRGLESLTHGIDREINVSDHWPLWTKVKLPSLSTKK